MAEFLTEVPQSVLNAISSQISNAINNAIEAEYVPSFLATKTYGCDLGGGRIKIGDAVIFFGRTAMAEKEDRKITFFSSDNKVCRAAFTCLNNNVDVTKTVHVTDLSSTGITLNSWISAMNVMWVAICI